jgi:hypothetical protein
MAVWVSVRPNMAIEAGERGAHPCPLASTPDGAEHLWTPWVSSLGPGADLSQRLGILAWPSPESHVSPISTLGGIAITSGRVQHITRRRPEINL